MKKNKSLPTLDFTIMYSLLAMSAFLSLLGSFIGPLNFLGLIFITAEAPTQTVNVVIIAFKLLGLIALFFAFKHSNLAKVFVGIGSLISGLFHLYLFESYPPSIVLGVTFFTFGIYILSIKNKKVR